MAGSVLQMLPLRLSSIPRGSGAFELRDFQSDELLVPSRSFGDVPAEFHFRRQDGDIRSSEGPQRRLVDAPTVQLDGTV